MLVNLAPVVRLEEVVSVKFRETAQMLIEVTPAVLTDPAPAG